MATFISWFLVIASAIWVGVDAGKIMPDKEKLKSLNSSAPKSPVGWFAGCLLLWIVFFPWYLSKRQDYLNSTNTNSKVNVSHCLSCTKYYEATPKFCPHCGSKTQWA